MVVNATGFPGSFALAGSIVRDAGTVLEVGAFVDMGPEAFNPAVICGRSLNVMGIGGEDLQAYAGTLALFARHRQAVPFAEMVSHTFRVADAALALETSLDAGTATKVLISNTLAPGRADSPGPRSAHLHCARSGLALTGGGRWGAACCLCTRRLRRARGAPSKRS